ncbi:hypothetical protein UK15_24525 [Streptomyces variegatus]|uniref:Uncharacterized protein n=1 Tax=Streptomyces variegatus TaxID=284040 RepID=A0A0M2GM31_9ACTN|nr:MULTISPECIES: hypothetical protein [Streptomyces]KJK36869.1 hypothetical protein UK15_24525 [Streptomyces variegatus]
MSLTAEDHSVRFHEYHLDGAGRPLNMSRVRVRKYCEVEEREVRNDEIGGHPDQRRRTAGPATSHREGDRDQAFVPLESIDPIQIGEGYYLQPKEQAVVKTAGRKSSAQS